MRESFISSREDERIDNYDVVCDNWRKLYQAMDKEELRERFHLERDEQALYLTFYNEKYRLDHKSGMLTLVHDPDRKLLFSTVISIYNLFHYAKPGARLAGGRDPAAVLDHRAGGRRAAAAGGAEPGRCPDFLRQPLRRTGPGPPGLPEPGVRSSLRRECRKGERR